MVYSQHASHRPSGRQELVEIIADGPRLITTSTHRYDVRGGGPKVPMPITSLRLGDDVLTCTQHGHGEWRHVTSIHLLEEEIPSFKVDLFPEYPANTMIIDSILTRGHGRARRRRFVRSEVQ